MKRTIKWKWKRLRIWFYRHYLREISEPKIHENRRYVNADIWLRSFLSSKMPDPADLESKSATSLSDDKLADFVFTIAADEHKDAADAQKQLVSKVYEQIKVSSAIIGGYAVLARWITEGLSDIPKDIVGFFALIALVCFLCSLISGVACARGLPYTPQIKAQHVLDWAEPGKSSARLKILSAAYMHRRVEANRHCNNWLSRRLASGWQLVTLGFIFVIVAIAIKLFI